MLSEGDGALETRCAFVTVGELSFDVKLPLVPGIGLWGGVTCIEFRGDPEGELSGLGRGERAGSTGKSRGSWALGRSSTGRVDWCDRCSIGVMGLAVCSGCGLSG